MRGVPSSWSKVYWEWHIHRQLSPGDCEGPGKTLKAVFLLTNAVQDVLEENEEKDKTALIYHF